MPLSADTIIDRLILKAQIRKWRLLAIIFAVLAVVVLFQRFAPHSVLQDDYIARISIDGFIGDDRKLYDRIDSVADDKKAKAAIIWLDTPGGSAVGGEEIYLRLRELAAHKPVVAVMRSVSAAAGYMAALGADYIVAREGTITGSIGVIVESGEVTELLQKIGVKPITIKSAPLKASPSPFEKTTPEAERVMKDVIMDFYDHFVDLVAERRQLPHEKALALADGRVFSGRKALEVKLVDALGGENEAARYLEEKMGVKPGLPIDDVEIPKDEPLFSRVLEGTIGKFWEKSRVGLDGLTAVWHPELH